MLYWIDISGESYGRKTCRNDWLLVIWIKDIETSQWIPPCMDRDIVFARDLDNGPQCIRVYTTLLSDAGVSLRIPKPQPKNKTSNARIMLAEHVL